MSEAANNEVSFKEENDAKCVQQGTRYRCKSSNELFPVDTLLYYFL